MLAYVFWHQPAAGVAAAVYEEALRAFHRALRAHSPDGFRESAAFGFRGVPWFPAESGYMDWYAIADFTSLGLLNEAAVAGARQAPHDDVARLAGAGLGGLFKLVAGSACFEQMNFGTWMKKPEGMSYSALLARAASLIDPASMGLWQRQMNLGPGLEFCIGSPGRVAAPAEFSPVAIELRHVTPHRPAPAAA
jgi:hypothetical protein